MQYIGFSALNAAKMQKSISGCAAALTLHMEAVKIGRKLLKNARLQPETNEFVDDLLEFAKECSVASVAANIHTLANKNSENKTEKIQY